MPPQPLLGGWSTHDPLSKGRKHTSDWSKWRNVRIHL